MNTIFKYNASAKYSSKDLKGGHNSINFSLLGVCLDEKGSSVKIQLPNILKGHRIVAKTSPMAVDYDEWALSNALWTKFYNSFGKYRAELNEYFSHVLVSVKFCHVLCYKCTWYFLAIP